MPHVKAWARRLRAVFRDTPPEVSVFCESGAPFVMARDPGDGEFTLGPEHRNMAGGMDQDAIVCDVAQGGRTPSGGGPWDGGGW